MMQDETSAAAEHTSLSSQRYCRHIAGPCLEAEALCARLCAAIATARPLLQPDFQLSGEIGITGCAASPLRPCRIAFRCTGDLALCLADVPAGADPDHLMQVHADRVPHSGPVIIAPTLPGRLQ